MSFQAEEYLGRLRKSAVSLFLPTLVLFVSAAVASYVSNIAMEQWVYFTVLTICGLAAALLWLVPVIRHLSFYVDLTNARVTIRRGLFGGQTIDLAWGEISEITFAKGRKIVIQPRSGEAIELDGMPQPKKLAATLRAHL
ncbi:MAG: hypothetical protein ACKOWR_04205 [Micrococcales bacterium]